jgi:hypothetical protein
LPEAAILVGVTALRGLQSRVSDSAMIDKPEPCCFPPPYGWFTKGFDTLDLKEAKALLAELAS